MNKNRFHIMIYIIILFILIKILIFWYLPDNVSSDISIFYDILKDKRVCIVGYNDALDQKEYGKDIDSYDVVIKFNNRNFNIKEKQYGKKRTIEVFHFNEGCPKISSDTRIVFIPSDIIFLQLATENINECARRNKNVKFIYLSDLITTRNIINKGYVPKSGTIIISLIVKKIDDLKCLHMYGIDGYKGLKYHNNNGRMQCIDMKYFYHNHCKEMEFYDHIRSNYKQIVFKNE